MITQRWNAFTDWFNRREYSENAVLLGFATAIGVLTALGVIAFYRTIDLAYAVFYRWPAPWLPPAVGLLYRPVVTGAGFALAWWVMRRFARGNDGLNVPDVQLAVVRRGGSIPARPAVARTVASAITIGSGGSAGSEGPVVVLGRCHRLAARTRVSLHPATDRDVRGMRERRRHQRRIQRPTGWRVLRDRGDPGITLRRVVLTGGRRERGRRCGLARRFRQPPRVPDSGRLRIRLDRRDPDLLPAPRRRHRLHVDRLRPSVFRHRCARGPIPPPARRAR